jgi:AbrB family looped-hinge helix DNA binding protein
MRINAKGQVTIPGEIRKRLGLLPGTEVEFETDGDTLKMRKADAPWRGRRIIEHLRDRATTTMSTDEIMALTRGPAA